MFIFLLTTFETWKGYKGHIEDFPVEGGSELSAQ